MKDRIVIRRAYSMIVSLIAFSCFALAAGSVHAERLQPIGENLKAPKAVALDAGGNLYVIEAASNRLLIYDKAGGYLRSYEGVDKPVSVALDRRDRIIVGNAGRGSVEVYSKAFKLLFKLGRGDGEFLLPGAIATDPSGKIYVADSKHDAIGVYNPDGSFQFSFGKPGSQDGSFHVPTALAIDPVTRELFVSDLPMTPVGRGFAEGARIQVFTLRGIFKRSFGSYGRGEGRLTRPMGLAIGRRGAVYVSDSFQNVVQVYDSAGTFLSTLYDIEHPMRNPLGITADGDGKIFISSLNSDTVEVYLDCH